MLSLNKLTETDRQEAMQADRQVSIGRQAPPKIIPVDLLSYFYWRIYIVLPHGLAP